MQHYKITTLIFAILFLSLLSCRKKPGNILDEKELQEVLYDVQLAQSIANIQSGIYNTPQKKKSIVLSALNKHGVSQANFDSTLIWYSDNEISRLNQINDTVAIRLRRQANVMKEDIASRNPNYIKSGQILPSIIYLTDRNPISKFNIDSLRLKNINIETFNWSFDTKGANPNQKIKASLLFTYKDTCIAITKSIESDKHYVFDKPNLPDSLLKDISGYIRFRNTAVPSNIVIFNVKNNDSSLLQDTLQQAKNIKAPDMGELK